MLILTGAGIRARHVLGVGLDLGLPTGVLAGPGLDRGRAERAHPRRPARRGRRLLPAARRGRPTSSPSTWRPAGPSSPTATRPTASTSSRRPPARSRRTAPTPARSCSPTPTAPRRNVYVKDVDGVYTGDPNAGGSRAHPRDDGRRAPRRRPGDAARRPDVPRGAHDARHINAVQVVNGLVSGNLTRALRDEHVGTIIRSS